MNFALHNALYVHQRSGPWLVSKPSYRVTWSLHSLDGFRNIQRPRGFQRVTR